MISDYGNKAEYNNFCKKNYVPIYSQPWWLDAICGPDSWDVWLYKMGGKTVAAMPYYFESRGIYNYVTKAPLTQNNGIIFEDSSRRIAKEASFEEKVINAACEYIEQLNLDVYEQQYQHSFVNWSPFFWNGYSCILRYSYIIEDTSDMNKVWNDFTAENRNIIRKGQKLTKIIEYYDSDDFYRNHSRIYEKQGLDCPFSKELWNSLVNACNENNAGKMFVAFDMDNNINAIMYLVWDLKSVYLLMGGAMPEYSSNQAYSSLIYYGIKFAHEKGLAFDFEGSMIKRIAKSYREYGGVPTPYYRIRKVFNPDIILKEANDLIVK